MKKIISLFAVVISLSASAAFAAPENYTLDPSHTNIYWKISHFGFSSPSGKFADTSGTLVLDEANPENSKVKVVIKTASVVTGIPKLDEHLQTPDFFDSLKFPEATFSSFKVTKTGKTTAKIQGDLTLRGITKRITLNAHLNKIDDNMVHKHVAGFTLKGKIKRSDFGMRAYLPGLSDEVLLDIEVEADRDEAKK